AQLGETISQIEPGGSAMANQFKLRWLKGKYKHWQDEIPEHWFRKIGRSSGTHDLLGPHGAREQAKCLVHVRSTSATLDYTHASVKKFNDDNEIVSGVLKLTFNSNSRTSISEVHWRWPDETVFEPWTKKTEWTLETEKEPDDLDLHALKTKEGRAK